MAFSGPETARNPYLQQGKALISVAVMQLCPASDFDDAHLKDFRVQQSHDHGGKVEIADGFWAGFAAPSTDAIANAMARSLLTVAPFAHDLGVSADEAWTLYYVDAANRLAAMHWFAELPAILDGEIRPASPVPRAHFVRAVHSIRRNLYRGGELSRCDTQLPWVTKEIAFSFRFIKQRVEARRDFAVMDALYLLERAVEA